MYIDAIDQFLCLLKFGLQLPVMQYGWGAEHDAQTLDVHIFHTIIRIHTE